MFPPHFSTCCIVAFRQLDGTRTGRVALAHMRSAYDTSLHPDVVAGRLTKDDALRNFMSQVSSVVVLAASAAAAAAAAAACARFAWL